MTTEHAPAAGSPTFRLSPQDTEVLRAIHAIAFGTVEIIIHDSRITEIRQTRRTRLAATPQA